MPRRRIDVSLAMDEGDSFEGIAEVEWRHCASADGELALYALDSVKLVQVCVDGQVLGVTALDTFRDVYQPRFKEELEWIAMSAMAQE
jgi:hypothetical protein